MAQFLEKNLKRFQKALESPGLLNDVLKYAENLTGINRIYIAPGAFGFLAVYLVFGFGAQLVCNSIGFFYPAYASIKAIESKEKDDDTKWLTYWVVYSCFTVVEFFSDILLSWFPLYWLGKCVFLVFCFAPNEWNGSKIIYQKIIRPVFLNYEAEIDDTLEAVGNAMGTVGEAANQATKLISNLQPKLIAAGETKLRETVDEEFY